MLQHLGLYDDARLFCDWLEAAEWFDCRGPLATAKWAGVPPEARWASFFREERRRVQEIGRETQRPPGSTLSVLMHMAGPLIGARCT